MGKASKTAGKQHIHSRISFLFEAATYLSNVEQESKGSKDAEAPRATPKDTVKSTGMIAARRSHDHGDTKAAGDESADSVNNMSTGTAGLSQLYVSQLRSISHKSVIRLSSDMKRAMCKRCNTVLEPGSTATVITENASRNGRKPHANILVIKCNACGASKRFPDGARRQMRKKHRPKTEAPTPKKA